MRGRLASLITLLPALPYVLFLALEQWFLRAYPVGGIPIRGFSLSEKLLNNLYHFFRYGF